MIIFQKQNLLLIIAGIGFLIQKITAGSISILAHTIFTMAIIIWAYEEASTGVDVFRKLLGTAVLILMALSLLTQLQ